MPVQSPPVMWLISIPLLAGHWDSMEEYTCMIPRDTHDGAFYRAVLALHQDLFSLAQQVHGSSIFIQSVTSVLFQKPRRPVVLLMCLTWLFCISIRSASSGSRRILCSEVKLPPHRSLWNASSSVLDYWWKLHTVAFKSIMKCTSVCL